MELPSLEDRKPTAYEFFQKEGINSEAIVREYVIDTGNRLQENLLKKWARKLKLVKILGVKRVVNILKERYF